MVQAGEEDDVTLSCYALRVPALGGVVSRTQVTAFETATTLHVDQTTMARRIPGGSMQVAGYKPEGGRS